MGKLIAAGEVGELLKGEKVLVIASPDIEKLKIVLDKHPAASRYTFEKDTFKVALTTDVNVTSISRELMENGIVVSKLEEKKQSLEDQFLELVK